MIANWIHIVIVHFAVIGSPWLTYRVFVLRKQSLDAKPWKTTFSAILILAIISTIAYFTGPEAADYTKGVVESYNQDHVENHAIWGRVSFVIQIITGLIAIMAWSSILQDEKPDKRISILLLLFLSVNTFIVFYTAHLGGLIRRMDLTNIF